MKRETLLISGLVVLGALATVVGLAYATLWYVAIFSPVPCCIGLVGLVLSLLAIVTLRRARSKSSPGLRRVGNRLLVVGGFLFLQLAYEVITPTLRHWEIRRAQTFLHALIPELEAYHKQYGIYPSETELVSFVKKDYPRLLELAGAYPMAYDNRHFYFRRGETYGFQFYVPDGFIGFHYEYCCGAEGIWSVTD